MVELLKRQRMLWQWIENIPEKPPMLRLSREDDCFWICDLPRRCGEAVCNAAKEQAIQAGFIVHLDTARLWRIDLPLTDPLFTAQTTKLLPLPKRDTLHPVYALYRLLSAHPAPLADQPIELLRSILKLTMRPPEESPYQTAQLAAQCAARLNRKQPLPSAACFALAHYISQEDEQ